MLCGGGSLRHKRLGYPRIYAKEDDEKGLQGVHDEYKIKGLLVGNAVEDKHGFHREMPWTGTVGSWYNDCYGADDEGDKGTGDAEVGGGIETEKGEVVMDEVAAPYRQGVENKQRLVPYAAQRHHALPYTAEGGAHLVIYAEAAQQEMEEDKGGNGTDGGDEIAGKGELGQYGVDARAGLLEECAEDAHLPQQGDAGDGKHQQGVDGTLGDHGAKGLGERHSIVLAKDATACELADARHDKGGGIAHEDAVDAGHGTGMLANRTKSLTPAPATEHLGKGTEGHGEKHPRPVHLVKHHVLDAPEIEVTVHPVEDGRSQHYRHGNLHHARQYSLLCCHKQIWVQR